MTNKCKSIAGLIFITLFSSCKDTPQDLARFRDLDEGLMNSNEIIHDQTFAAYRSLESKLSEPVSAEKVAKWYSKAMLIKKLSDNVTNYIEGLKADLKKEIGNKNINGKDNLIENNVKSVQLLFETKGKGNELYRKLQTYKDSILNIDDRLNFVFKDKIKILPTSFASGGRQMEFNQSFFDHTPAIAALATLSMFENKIKITENEVVTFCNTLIVAHDNYFNFFSTLIGQSTNHVKAGESFEINASVGAFCNTCNTEVTINGIKIPTDPNGMALHRFQASVKPGKHFVPVKVSFTNHDGIKDSMVTTITYFVDN